MRLRKLTSNTSSGDISLLELSRAFERPTDFSEFIILSLGALQNYIKTSPDHYSLINESLHLIRQHFVEGDYKKAIELLSTQYSLLPATEPLKELVLNKVSKLEPNIEIYKNHPRRFLENRIAQLEEGISMDSLVDSAKRVLANCNGFPIHTIDDVFKTLVNLEEVSDNYALMEDTDEPNETSFAKLPPESNLGFVLVNKKLFVIDRIGQLIKCINENVDDNKIINLRKLCKNEIKSYSTFKAREVVTIIDNYVPDWLGNSENIIKTDTSIYSIKDRIYKTGIGSNVSKSNTTIQSANLGVMTSLTPNYTNETNLQFLSNRNPDRGIVRGLTDGYSYLNPHHTFVGSISGHAFGMISILLTYCQQRTAIMDKYKIDDSQYKQLNNDVNNIMRAFIMAFISHGYHGYGEIVDVIKQPNIQSLFKKFNIVLESVIPDSILEMSFRDAQEYTRNLTLKDAAVFEIIRKDILAQRWENCCLMLKSYNPTQILKYLNEANLTPLQFNSLLEISHQQGYETVFDSLIVFKPEYVNNQKFHFVNRLSPILRIMIDQDIYRHEELRNIIKTNCSKIWMIHYYLKLQELKFHDLSAVLFTIKDINVANNLIYKLIQLPDRDIHSIMKLLSDPIATALLKQPTDKNLQKFLALLEFKIAKVTDKTVIDVVLAKDNAVALAENIISLVNLSELTPESRDFLISNPEYAAEYIKLQQKLDKSDAAFDYIKAELLKLVQLNPDLAVRVNSLVNGLEYAKNDFTKLDSDLALLGDPVTLEICRKNGDNFYYLDLLKLKAHHLLTEYQVTLSQHPRMDNLADNLIELEKLDLGDHKRDFLTILLNNPSSYIKTLYKKISDGGILDDSKLMTIIMHCSNNASQFIDCVDAFRIIKEPNEYLKKLETTLYNQPALASEEFIEIIHYFQSLQPNGETLDIRSELALAAGCDLNNYLMMNIEDAGNVLTTMSELCDETNLSAKEKTAVAMLLFEDPGQVKLIFRGVVNLYENFESSFFDKKSLKDCLGFIIADPDNSYAAMETLNQLINMDMLDLIPLSSREHAKSLIQLFQALETNNFTATDKHLWVDAFSKNHLLEPEKITTILSYFKDHALYQISNVNLSNTKFDNEDLSYLISTLSPADKSTNTLTTNKSLNRSSIFSQSAKIQPVGNIEIQQESSNHLKNK